MEQFAQLEGFHALKHALRFDASVTDAMTTDYEGTKSLALTLAPDVWPKLNEVLRVVTSSELSRSSPRKIHTKVLAFAKRPIVEIGTLHPSPEAPLVVLEDPRDLGNVGAAVRVAAAAGAGGLIVTGSSDPWDPVAIRGSAGLHFAIPVCHSPELPQIDGLWSACDSEEAASRYANPDSQIFLFGSERRGLSPEAREHCSSTIKLPMIAGVSSINLACSVGAVLYLHRYSLEVQHGHNPLVEP